MSMSGTTEMGRLQDFTIDQAAGATALVLGSVGALLAVIWRSKCHCRVNLCWHVLRLLYSLCLEGCQNFGCFAHPIG